MAENKPCDVDVLADRIVELVKGIDDSGEAGCEVSRLLRDELPALWEWSSQESEVERLRAIVDTCRQILERPNMLGPDVLLSTAGKRDRERLLNLLGLHVRRTQSRRKP